MTAYDWDDRGISKSTNVNGYTVTVSIDDDGGFANPRDNDGNVSVIVGESSRHDVGDGTFASVGLLSPSEYLESDEVELPFECELCGLSVKRDRDRFIDYYGDEVCETGEDILHEIDEETQPAELNYAEYVKRETGATLVLAVEVNSNWSPAYTVIDSADLPLDWSDPSVLHRIDAIAYVLPSKVLEGFGEMIDLDGQETALRNEVEQFSLWASGEVYYYTVEDQDGKIVDSCSGYLGDEYVTEEAIASAESLSTEDSRPLYTVLYDHDASMVIGAVPGVPALVTVPGYETLAVRADSIVLAITAARKILTDGNNA